MEIFTWNVDEGANLAIEVRKKTAQFGNGYEQTVLDGINTTREIWNISLFRTQVELLPMYNFLKDKQEVTPFMWTTPLGETMQFKSSEVKMSHSGADTWNLTATFTQDFSPS